ncbi:MarR family winged helix-turn-helix transcriptional regulator [Pedobacter sp. MW01-1-1]|uniref:MarR family winged helix-turn-helix transcriptional regulator n=1 Tax=Pedobacter sp. MW01-1-1 TaxID=3383027 RepID=UPI003FEF8DF0
MNYQFLKDLVDLAEDFDLANSKGDYKNTLDGFKSWIVQSNDFRKAEFSLSWEGKEDGRSAESVISTLLVHMNRFAKSYSRAAIMGSDFSTQEDFIYLINLKAFGKMTKMDLIKRNVHEKSVGILIINRLMKKGWVEQQVSEMDRRSKIIGITVKGLTVLDNQMSKIRQATKAVSGNLSLTEKLTLVHLLTKLNDFHQPLYERNLSLEDLLQEAAVRVRLK